MPEIISTTNTTYQIYPRGFLGVPLANTVQPPTNHVIQRSQRLQYSTDLLQTATTYDYPSNPGVDQVYQEYLLHGTRLSLGTFRDNVLIQALNAFGTQDFLSWVQVQAEAPTTGDMHARFLNDTLRFILTGKREMSLETWQNLVLMSSSHDWRNLTDYQRDFFWVGATQPRHGVRTLPELIQTWCSNEDGMEDMLGTLHIFFGAL